MRLFDDPAVMQAFLHGGVHRHLIRSWLTRHHLHPLSNCPITERAPGRFYLLSSIVFQLRKASITHPQPAILWVKIDHHRWPFEHNQAAIAHALRRKWTTISNQN